MTKKQNYHAYRKGTKDGEIKFGHIHNDNVLSAFMVRSGYDYRHYMTMDADDSRQGWTIMRCPGAFNIKAGDDIPYGRTSIYIEAINGDIVLRAKNGRIKLDAENIDLIANGTDTSTGIINMESNEAINSVSKNITADADSTLKLKSSGDTQIIADASLNIYGGLIDGATGACKIKPPLFDNAAHKLNNITQQSNFI